MKRTLGSLVKIAAILTCIFVISEKPLADEMATAEIVHLSRTTVYIDKGEIDGVSFDSDLVVYRQDREIGRLLVEYIAMHSASCRIANQQETLKVGDEVRFRSILKPERPLVLPPKELEFKLSGRATAAWLHFSDAGDTENDFTQPTFYLRLDGRNVKRKPLSFHLRMRNKFTTRASDLSDELEKREWRHRVYQAYTEYGSDSIPYLLRLGRIYSQRIGSVGSWDGAQIEYRFSKRFKAVVFGGGEPDWKTFAADFDNYKYGGYVSFCAGCRSEYWYRGVVGFVGRYSADDVNREFILWSSDAAIGTKFQIKQNLELDLNRDWRQEAAGEDQTLNRFSLTMAYMLTRALNFTCDYDYFQKVRDLNNRDIPDSLFADPIQKGIKLGLRARLSASIHMSGRIGFRAKDDQEKRPVYGNADFSWSNLFNSQTRLYLSCAYADGRYAKSLMPTLSLSRRFGRKLYQGVGLSSQHYDELDQDVDELNGLWLRWFGSYSVTEKVDINWQYGHITGDVGEGERMYAGLTYRL